MLYILLSLISVIIAEPKLFAIRFDDTWTKDRVISEHGVRSVFFLHIVSRWLAQSPAACSSLSSYLWLKKCDAPACGNFTLLRNVYSNTAFFYSQRFRHLLLQSMIALITINWLNALNVDDSSVDIDYRLIVISNRWPTTYPALFSIFCKQMHTR